MGTSFSCPSIVNIKMSQEVDHSLPEPWPWAPLGIYTMYEHNVCRIALTAYIGVYNTT